MDDLGQPTSPVPVPASTQEDRDNLVRSIEDITTPDEVSNFALKAPITFGDQSVADLIVGTVKKDKITGSIAKYLQAEKAKISSMVGEVLTGSFSMTKDLARSRQIRS